MTTMATILRKRPMTLVFSDAEEDSSQAWPATPTKRRSGFNQSLTQVIPPPNFAACLARDDKGNDTDDSNDDLEGGQGGKSDCSDEDGLLPISTDMLTPPMTPTRRKSARSSMYAIPSLSPSLSSASDDTENNSPPRTPSRRRTPLGDVKSLVGNTTPNSHNSNSMNNSTGLTPALNRMLKKHPNFENIVPPKMPNFEQYKEEAKSSNYLKPKRLVRSKSNLESGELSLAKKKGLSESTTAASVKTEDAMSIALSSSPAPSTALGYYQEAKTLFRRTTEPQRLVGRAAERETLQRFCQDHMIKAKAGSLYISGQPGTGKTALLKEVMRDMAPEFQEADHTIKSMLINCMTIKDPKMIYHKLLEELDPNMTLSKDKDAAVKAVESFFHAKNKSKVIVTILDEIDQLLSRDQEVLYKLFEWSSMEDSKLTLIGIANALDMTDRFLPRLKAKNCEPQLLNFNPYQVAEIKAIIMDRLFSLEGTVEEPDRNKDKDKEKEKDRESRPAPRVAPLMQRPAIELCARKVAAATGDLRKALDICRQTIEMVEMETKKRERAERLPSHPMPLQEISLSDLENRAAGGVTRTPLSRSASSLAIMTTSTTSTSTTMSKGGAEMALQEVPKVTVEHVKKALASAFGSPMVQKMRSLNVHQKILLAVMVHKIQSDKTVDCQIGKIFDHYTSVCRSTGKIGAVNRSEYQDLVNMLEANGLVTLGKAKEERLRKVDLVPREGEVLEAIKGQEIIDAIANGLCCSEF
ncbi:AAA ATPase [Podila epigama]|nr:AAA ATPase [Podila epigama]